MSEKRRKFLKTIFRANLKKKRLTKLYIEFLIFIGIVGKPDNTSFQLDRPDSSKQAKNKSEKRQNYEKPQKPPFLSVTLAKKFV